MARLRKVLFHFSMAGVRNSRPEPVGPRVHPSTRSAIVRELVGWFSQNQRKLPWRETRDPYAILVSEIMLQQTQVETVIPYYHRFLERFPDFKGLADAPEEQVLYAWAGLGYYRRARGLQACARRVMEKHAGYLPRNRKDLLALPGIGPYTAGAILSIAFDEPAPLVDGNVERVLSRLFLLDLDLSTTRGKKGIWEIAEQLVPEQGPGDFNQGLMELGATVCRPMNPECGICPLKKMCEARKQGKTSEFPVKTRNGRSVEVQEVVMLVHSGEKWLIVSTNDRNLYPGMWQFPWEWLEAEDDSVEAALGRLANRLGISTVGAVLSGKTRHAVTFRKIETHVFEVSLSGPLMGGDEIRWATQKELNTTGLPAYQRRILKQSLGPG